VGVSEILARYAVQRAHVLVVEVPGCWSLRVALERQVLSRGWQLAESPADADVLVVCGQPGPELGELVDRVWDQLPGPRVRLGLPRIEALDGALDAIQAGLVDTANHRADARQRPATPGMDHGDMDHGDMAPHGIPLAGGGEDRDGLEMDVLHLPLGPVLRHWPAGLVLRCALQGDVVVGAQASILDGGHVATRATAAKDDARGGTNAWLCDQVCAVLSLAGWPDGAASARRVRDALIDDGSGEATRPALERLRREVFGSRLLRWSLRGVGNVAAQGRGSRELPEGVVGDVHDRLVRMLDRALAGQLATPVTVPALLDHPAALVGALPDLVTGLDLAAVRLLVASLALDTTPTREQVAHG